MSYEPTLIIDADTLKQVQFEDWYDTDDDEGKAMDYLRGVADDYTVHVMKDLRFIVCTPEFTSFNRSVREILTTLGVEYAEDN